jgi:hypothetical protein
MVCAINKYDNVNNNEDNGKNDEDANDKDEDDNQKGGGTTMMGHTTIKKQWGLRFEPFGQISVDIPCLLI